jgi:hypothetical protein
MKTSATALALAAALAAPALAAVNKDGGQPSVNPCERNPNACKGDAPQADEAQNVSEPMVIFLDAEGNTLVRMPLSKFREAEPGAKLPANVDAIR